MHRVRRALPLAALMLVPVQSAVAAPPKPPPKPKPAPKPVTQVGIGVDPATITYGDGATVAGQLKGNAAGKPLVLRGAPFPFQAFADVAQGATGSNGRYSMRVAPPITMRYQVISTTPPGAGSGIVQLTVRQRVEAAVSDTSPRHGQRVRFSGAVGPGHPGAVAYVQRRVPSTGRFRTVKRTHLLDAGLTRSVFSADVRIRHTGLYAVRVRGTANNAPGYSRLIAIHVH